ncbi:MAG: PqqD family protein [Eubacterium sp.]|nr:PqqD family protein [Eubacterium sp.]
MKVREGFILKKMGTQAVVIAIGSASKIFNGMVKLNETGELMWEKLVEGTTREELLATVLETYEVDEETATKDVDNFIETLKKPGIIE